MWGVIQLGVLAAFLVLFVPVGMAGWHLSRNRMLFFSCAIFITLAVCVHLTPFFLSSSGSLPLSSSSIVNLNSCISLLHHVAFDFQELNNENNSEKSWKWIETEPAVVQCDFQKLTKSNASDLFNGSWVVVAGDSQARLFVVSLLGLLLGESEMEMIREDLFKRHSDYNILIDKIGMKLDFIWAPYVSNLSDLVLGFEEKKSDPDVFVIGAGLWDMLQINNATDYGVSLKLLGDLVVLLLSVPSDFVNDGAGTNLVSVRSPNFFWLGMPKLINSMLNTNEKREKMTDVLWQAYTDELYSSKLLHQSGGPLVLLDIHALSNKCGARCTADGMHYHGVVYDAAVHVMLNELLIESNQKL
ncbi:putative Alpha-expansin 13 precursor [Capsicum annuum]|uniref:PC-Esterase n=1 Tax=Capsicum annuum TaxID=4072 RepID=A0A1U8FLU1_CAPAN|nr:protein ALTERED XYLOGLUCAN 9 [Capsicum annuum]XP_047263039.1 protein ALTERED XYLOGLUCAN 9 [Capsicum annuum]XP_047263040.1 protein ALTERED XYLOGLUCAN 9 [Capsicum annuum]XP_047263041.1 protein ALTERED XYLOGLUCAN 9 [Capsicum annuum]XP_047263042.1 protein ALTERED XYLOGLUCAN 9 [Capsicum annuum]XP_047263043.1 protein ALTERED XYLOGLUCAN 9 [Capsicum annuum]XP_047263044.1 protein ALTERED XYLOGLUCAN 9 [Capsicum annuum]XP_047263045.1 protein ALTERED XYLOGLUCAN 9 [Capsicum annuum]KAF3633849.1 putati